MASVGGALMDGISAIRNDNADALDESLREKKRARSATPRASAPRASTPSASQINKEIERQATAKAKEMARQEMRVPAAIAKKISKSDKERAARGNPAFLKKLTIIQRYMDNRTLAPILIDNVAHAVYSHTPKTEEEADAKLDAFKTALNAKRMDSKVDNLLGLGAKAVEWGTDEGRMVGMDLRGFASKVMGDKEELRQEMEEFKCLYGHLLTAPWWMRVGMFYMEKAKDTDSQNKFLGAPATITLDPSPSTSTSTSTSTHPAKSRNSKGKEAAQ